MIGGKSVLGLIIARGGSKGLPRKNLVDLGGMPVIAWSIDAALASRYVDRTVLSTEDEEIIQVARHHGCEIPFVRDGALATDEASGTAVVLDVLERVPGFDYVVLLQASSPLRRAEDIDGALAHCLKTGAPSCVGVTLLGKPREWLMTITPDGRLVPLFGSDLPYRRQDASDVYVPNGAIFVSSVEWLCQSRSFYGPDTVPYVMAPERSVDIDGPLDLVLARTILSGGNV